MGISLEGMHLRTLLPAPWALGVPAQEVCITRTKQFSNVGCSNPALCSQSGGLGLGLSAFVLIRNARMCLWRLGQGRIQSSKGAPVFAWGVGLLIDST